MDRAPRLSSLSFVALTLAACSDDAGNLERVRASIAVEPETLAFGDLSPGERRTKLFTLENMGMVPVTIDGAQFTAASDARFELMDDLPETLDARDFIETRVFFTSDQLGDTQALLSIGSEGKRLDLPMTARVRADVPPPSPGLEICIELAGVRSCPDEPRLDFGTAAIGGRVDARLVLRNAGAANLEVQVEIVERSGDGLRFEPTALSDSLAPQGERILDVQFAPSSETAARAILRVTSGDPARPSRDLIVSGRTEGTPEPEPEPPPPGCGAVRGTICGLDGVGPITNANVVIETPERRFSTATNAEGRFSFDCVPPGDWTVRATAASFSTSFPVSVRSEQISQVGMQCLDPRSARVAVVWGVYDAMEMVLAQLGVQYTLIDDPSGGPTLSNFMNDPATLAQFDIIFFNCGFEETLLYGGAGLTNLRNFVAQGGSVYASDLAYDVVEVGWPMHADFMGDDLLRSEAEWPSDCEFLDVRDPLLAGALGASQVTVDACSVSIDSVTAQTTVYLDSAQLGGGRRPQMIGFRPSTNAGRVFYTTFHNNGQPRTLDLFRWLIGQL